MSVSTVSPMENFLAISHTFDHGELPLPDLLGLCIALYMLWVHCHLYVCPGQMQTAQRKLNVQMSLVECFQLFCSSTRPVSPLRNACGVPRQPAAWEAMLWSL